MQTGALSRALAYQYVHIGEAVWGCTRFDQTGVQLATDLRLNTQPYWLYKHRGIVLTKWHNFKKYSVYGRVAHDKVLNLILWQRK